MAGTLGKEQDDETKKGMQFSSNSPPPGYFQIISITPKT